jgi:hypothetical protein
MLLSGLGILTSTKTEYDPDEMTASGFWDGKAIIYVDLYQITPKNAFGYAEIIQKHVSFFPVEIIF